MIEVSLAGLLTYPQIDPILLEIGPLAIRWYSLAYIAGLLGGWAYMTRLIRIPAPICKRTDLDDFILWAMLAIVIGGRLGYVLFYNFPYYSENPAAALRLWDGGMSFHGGLVGMSVALIWFCARHHIPLFQFTDRIACVAPLGLFFGRVANFINGELYGRVTDSPFGMVFPHGGPLPRHPSQLYEAALEGVLLFALLNLLFHFTASRNRPGILTGLFLIGYAAARVVVELVREPDSQLGYLFDHVTMGQLLSLPIALAGFVIIILAFRKAPLRP
ncbi:prolipoprotein diacylglyceryl transferase [Govanella unica]|uniref:Phosphatidylglycerol--prolipoprotein diacylglyceryl transferase n=1 Tax=Govanella unica TaxID=2975056 RepID=A0A9X3Z868_9PROT|nr:prolipoprotein diacylglyceryl transferase [Govania unica]MDA5194778.1 prolipoprotein diacylglyceryl transferase [Govania unica]